ncbi:alpha/beta hydrolase family protein [Pseudonocardia spinosispora]|uniref:alpha/beta hydrolase family protein n=1 Tax=Pseudonocardia spinosispora TaxID=103441 RepID=UPI0004241781|nr:alpha/beta fold hydrolase [Pseudonocardia spinosispora]
MEIVRYGQADSQFAEVWRPDGETKPGAVLLLHGGWWRARYDLRLMDGLAADLVSRGHVVWNVEYRRIETEEPDGSDRGGWPETLEDVLAAIKTLCEASPGADPREVVAVGHSAGGHLGLLAGRPAGLGGVLALAPITDLADCARRGLGEGATPLFLGAGGESAYRHASPIEQVPIGCPQLIVHGTRDDRVPIEHSRAYLQRCQAEGDTAELREVAGGDHMFVLDPLHAYWAPAVRWMVDVVAGR